MKLLICTQAVDLDDPVLGFFHRWIAEFSKEYERVHVICLKEGRHTLPENVSVHSLGKEGGRSRLKYVWNFYRYIRRYRGEYDAVFVHMNQEYVLMGGALWRLWGKRVVLWRNHKMGTAATRVAGKLAHVVCYTSPSAFVVPFPNSKKMPIGIDTEFFSPASLPPKSRSILFLGRLDPVKRVMEFVRALEKLHEEGTAFSATIVGDSTDPAAKYSHDVRNLAAPLCLDGTLEMRAGVTNEQARDLFRSHAIYCNLTPSGSFDKTIGEAMACRCVCVVANDAVKNGLPERFLVQGDPVGATTDALRAALQLPEEERREITAKARGYIEREHSLALLSQELVHILHR